MSGRLEKKKKQEKEARILELCTGAPGMTSVRLFCVKEKSIIGYFLKHRKCGSVIKNTADGGGYYGQDECETVREGTKPTGKRKSCQKLVMTKFSAYTGK